MWKDLDLSEENLASVEYLLSQSIKGFHFIFEREEIKLALVAPLNGISKFEHEDREKVQQIFMDFLSHQSLDEKENYLNAMAPMEKELLIKAYFNIVECTIKRCQIHEH